MTQVSSTIFRLVSPTSHEADDLSLCMGPAVPDVTLECAQWIMSFNLFMVRCDPVAVRHRMCRAIPSVRDHLWLCGRDSSAVVCVTCYDTNLTDSYVTSLPRRASDESGQNTEVESSVRFEIQI